MTCHVNKSDISHAHTYNKIKEKYKNTFASLSKTLFRKRKRENKKRQLKSLKITTITMGVTFRPAHGVPAFTKHRHSKSVDFYIKY